MANLSGSANNGKFNFSLQESNQQNFNQQKEDSQAQGVLPQRLTQISVLYFSAERISCPDLENADVVA
jgi:hypothetical protein